MFTFRKMARTDQDDSELVAASLRGSKDAFEIIVERYQSLICSIAYSAAGSLSASEDLAQETFLTAWKNLGELREPSSLRSWLCAIARNLVNNAARRAGRHQPASLDTVEALEENAGPESTTTDLVISREEESIMWRALERIPELYREPLVLFYRERESIEKVAQALGLSEDAVKQRLSRGRKLLREEVAAFVEGTLARSGPGKALTLAIVAGLPMMAASATAAGAAGAAGAAKSGAVAKSAGLLAAFASSLAPFVGFAGGYLGYKVSMNAARTDEERSLIKIQNRKIWVGVLIFLPAMAGFIWASSAWQSHPPALFTFATVLAVGFATWIIRTGSAFMRESQTTALAARGATPESGAMGGPQPWWNDYKSKLTFLGLPLAHIRLGQSAPGAKSALGWIAVGDKAIGIIFAMGGGAIGLVSLGGVSIGVISVGTISVGLFSMGCISVGFFALGSMAYGIIAMGGFSAAWTMAAGALAMSLEYATGSTALAPHANDLAAKSFFATHHLESIVQLLLVVLVFLTIAPLSLVAWITRKKSNAISRSI